MTKLGEHNGLPALLNSREFNLDSSVLGARCGQFQLF